MRVPVTSEFQSSLFKQLREAPAARSQARFDGRFGICTSKRRRAPPLQSFSRGCVSLFKLQPHEAIVHLPKLLEHQCLETSSSLKTAIQ
eukprot:8887875-Alexandrium_andersonii.AAC.1